MNYLEVLDAAAFAMEAHSGQVRKDAEGSPYIRHPIEVAQLLSMAGIEDSDIICAALLHDVVEDCGVDISVIASMFGSRVAGIVADVSDDPALHGAVRRDAQVVRAGLISPEARLVKVADKICNMSDILYRPPVDWDAAKKADYFNFANRVFVAADIPNEYLRDCFNEVMARGAF